MKRVMGTLAIVLLVACLPAAAQAAHPSLGNFGIADFDVTFTNEDGTMTTEAGSHPFATTVLLKANVDGAGIPEGWLKDFFAELPPGWVPDTTAYPRCTNADFLRVEGGANSCPIQTQLGINAVSSAESLGSWSTAPVFNLVPPPGIVLRLGFSIGPANITVDGYLSPKAPHNGVGAARNTAQLVEVVADKNQLWGDPLSPGHDEMRGTCGVGGAIPAPGEEFEFEGSGKSCPLDAFNPKPFLTLPTDCSAPLDSHYEAFSWEGEEDFGLRETHDAEGNPQPFTGCAALGFKPSISAQPTSRAAQSPTGLDFSLQVKDEGLTSVTGRSQSSIRKVVATLPEGFTANPSLAEGLEVCSEADLAKETLQAAPGEGCPEASKIGTLEVESPLVEGVQRGALFIAEPYQNQFHSLLALYIVIKNPALGIIVKQAAKIEPDPQTGQLVTITDEIPPLPFSRFRLHLREGGRSPLISPRLCGTYQAKALFTPWSGTAPVPSTSEFEIISGPNESPCPPGGTAPFEPGFEAGSQNNAAGAYSPFSMRLTRRDGDQDLTRFDVTLPPGVLAKLAGVQKCSDAQISLAKTKTGKAELRSPSCPGASRIGTVWGGAGAGSQLTYVPGSIYLAGPFGGAPLSAVGIVAAVAGPFDVGTVVVRQALDVDPRSGEVSADGAHSDPIPHILAGIPLAVRDVQIHVDRPQFTINPTSCDRFEAKAAIWGGGASLFSSADDSPAARQARYQAANCSRLAFKPRLSFKLRGGTHRGDHPALHSVLRPRPGDANIAGAVVRLPRSAFLDQGHIRTICTRVQYAAKACPQGAVYGHVRAYSPLLEEPLEGPAYLRSSNHNLPDLVFSLHGLVDFEAAARVDSQKGGIRVTFNHVPDAPISKVIVDMQGAKKGLIVNSTDLCAAEHRASVRLDAHNGKRITIRPLMGVGCGGQGKRGVGR